MSYTTCFLAWSGVANAADAPVYISSIELLELDIIVQRDSSGQTWGVWIAGDVVVDGLATASMAQLHAVAAVTLHLVDLAGDPPVDATTDLQNVARSILTVIHRGTCKNFEHRVRKQIKETARIKAKNEAFRKNVAV